MWLPLINAVCALGTAAVGHFTKRKVNAATTEVNDTIDEVNPKINERLKAANVFIDRTKRLLTAVKEIVIRLIITLQHCLPLASDLDDTLKEWKNVIDSLTDGITMLEIGYSCLLICGMGVVQRACLGCNGLDTVLSNPFSLSLATLYIKNKSLYQDTLMWSGIVFGINMVMLLLVYARQLELYLRSGFLSLTGHVFSEIFFYACFIVIFCILVAIVLLKDKMTITIMTPTTQPTGTKDWETNKSPRYMNDTECSRNRKKSKN